MSKAAPLITIRDIAVFERTMPFTTPFRFGSVTVTAAPQAFVRVEIDVAGHARASGATAEMMMPKWFDKNPAKTVDETVGDLRDSLVWAVRAYAEATSADTAFGHHCAVLPRQAAWAEGLGLPALTANFGPALVDKAILDALLNAMRYGLAEGLRRNVPGLDARLTPDLESGEVADFLQSLRPSRTVAIRYTIGLLDDLDGIAAAIGLANLRYFKIKIGGDVAADLARLRSITALLTALAPQFRATLDANEHYDAGRLALLLEALASDPALARLADGLLYIEQPFDRGTTFGAPLDAASMEHPFIIDEADGEYDTFPRAAELGYRGVSSKSCKGLYKSLLNAARARAWNRRDATAGWYFVAGEDLTCQAGLSVQQDTALAAVLGINHVERNGHHYVDGFGHAPDAEAERFLRAHPVLYHRHQGRPCLNIQAGSLPTASLLFTPGFASGAEPDWASLDALGSQSAFEETVL